MRLLALALLVMAVAACSDRVPAPVTPTPSPRPGYPPAQVSELPEGVLFVKVPQQAPLFRLRYQEEAELITTSYEVYASPDGSRGAVVLLEGDAAVGIGILTGSRLEEAARFEESASGTFARRLAETSWSSDGRRLAYAIPEGPDEGWVRVWMLDTESGEKRLLTAEPAVYSLLGWTAAGDVLASTPEGLVLLGETRRAIELPEPGAILDIEMSPDGRSVAVNLGESEPRARDLTYVHSSGIWVLGLLGGGWREIVDLAAEPSGVPVPWVPEMRWSPDGRRITIHRTRMDERGVVTDGLSVLDARTGEETVVHEYGWGEESWSPDGRYLAYTYDTGEPNGKWLGILGPDGRKRQADAHPSSMAWAGNGRLLVDIPGKLGILDPEIMEVADVRTEEGKTISVDLGTWSPSGRYVAAETGADDYHRSSLYVIDTEAGKAELFLEEAQFFAVAWLRE